MMQQYQVIGLMSGTSLDGLDLAYCVFTNNNNQWQFEIKIAETVSYSEYWIERLNNAWKCNAFDFVALHKEYGKYCAEITKLFIQKNHIKADFVASHGHTIFHQPDRNITFQIGDGATMSALLNLPVICDFRSVDVALNGQGAPLVPIGDMHLFSQYFFRLNLGGIANISFSENDHTIAYDICPFNMSFNYLAEKMGVTCDTDGLIAASGVINNQMLTHLDSLDYYTKNHPKSLGREWFTDTFLPVIEKYKLSVPDTMRTVAEHAANQIAIATGFTSGKKILITGGGALNRFVISLIAKKCKNKIVVPDKNILDFKEALIFGFLGVLRYTNSINCLKSVTGALKDNIGGCIYTC